MAGVLNRKRNALEPALVLSVASADGSYADMSLADGVQFCAQLTTGATEITIDGTLTDVATRENTFEPQAGDFDVPGIYFYDVVTTVTPGREAVDPEDDDYGVLTIHPRAQDS